MSKENDPLPDPLIQLNLYMSEDKKKAILKLTGQCRSSSRPGVDLVVALDVSNSMNTNGKLKVVKKAMGFLLGTDPNEGALTKEDRLAIIIFSKEVTLLSKSFEPMTNVNKKALLEKVNNLSTTPNTNMWGALTLALELLQQDRGDMAQYRGNRPAAIFLLSDGKQMPPQIEPKNLSDHPVYTFGFGKDHDSKVLYNIAMASFGGTFNHVVPRNLAKGFKLALAPIRSSLIRDLMLKVEIQDKIGWRMPRVEVGSLTGYPETKRSETTTINFGYLSCGEVRTFSVKLGKDAADPNYPMIHVKYEYNSWVPPPASTSSHSFELNWRSYGICVQTSILPKGDTTEIRLKFASHVIEAVEMAKDNEEKLEYAKKKMDVAMDYLRENMDFLRDDNKINEDIAQLKAEGEELQRIMSKPASYKEGLPFALSVLSSYLRQRPMAIEDDLLLSSMHISIPSTSSLTKK